MPYLPLVIVQLKNSIPFCPRISPNPFLCLADQTRHSAASDMGLHGLLRRVCPDHQAINNLYQDKPYHKELKTNQTVDTQTDSLV